MVERDEPPFAGFASLSDPAPPGHLSHGERMNGSGED
jgi:hypothetical protein